MCERIPYLILPVRQLSREPFSSRRSVRRSEPFAEAIRGSGRASRRARLDPNHGLKRYTQAAWQAAGLASNHPPKRRERAVGQYAGPVSIRTIHRSDTSEPAGPSRAEAIRASRQASRRARLEAEPSAEAIYASRLASRRARLESCAATRAATHTAPSTERSVEQAIAAELRTIRCSSRSRRAPPIPNRTT